MTARNVANLKMRTLDFLPRSYYSDVKYHLTMRSQSNGALVLNLHRLQYHLKPQPWYTKPYNDLSCTRVKAMTCMPRQS
ncbi:hypothetical protein P692DRAFT_20842459 [Suillus brevipes Sb2]|nr:hypothetical protein P692DRAFT_20842459 [Suillus brevipes Sb2]